MLNLRHTSLSYNLRHTSLSYNLRHTSLSYLKIRKPNVVILSKYAIHKCFLILFCNFKNIFLCMVYCSL